METEKMKSIQKLADFLKEEVTKWALQYGKDCRRILTKKMGELGPNLRKEDIYKEIQENYAQSDFMKYGQDLYHVLAYLDYIIDDNQEYLGIFDNFAALSRLLLQSKLPTRDDLNIIYVFLQRNIRIINNDDSVFLNAKDLKPFQIAGMNKEEYNKFLFSKDLNEVLQENPENLTYEQQQFQKQVAEYLNNLKTIHPQAIIYSSLESHYFANDNYTEKDIKFVMKAFQALKINAVLREKIEYLLQNQLEKRKQKETEYLSMEPKSASLNLEKLAPRDYKKLYHKIQSIYDIDLQRVIYPLTYDEMISLSADLVRLGIEEKEIKTCLKNLYQVVIFAYPNTIAEYYAFFDKIMAHSDNEVIANAISYLDLYLEDIKNAPDKVYRLDEINKLFWQIRPIINEDLDYDIDLGKRLAKIKSR